MKDFFNKGFYHNTIGEWALALLILLGSFVLARLIYLIFSKIFLKAASKTDTKIDDIIVETVKEPVVFGMTIMGLWYAMSQLSFPDSWSEWIGHLNTVLISISITWLIARFVDAIIKEYLIPFAEKSASTMDDQLIPVVRKGLRAVIWILGVIVALNNAGFNVGALLAGLGIGGLALAMAAKDTVANIFGGITIYTDKPFIIHDRVKIGGFDGFVTEIGIRSTRLKTLAGRIVTIPNSKFTDEMVENVSLEPWRKVTLNIGLVYDTPAAKMEKAMEILKQIVADNNSVEDDHFVGFNNFGDFSLGIIFIYYIKDGGDIFGAQSAINLEIMRSFEKHELEMAFPTQTLYTKKMD